MLTEKEKSGCYQCDSLIIENQFVPLQMSNRGYGSLFDSCQFIVQLCGDCAKPEYTEWFNEQPEHLRQVEIYQFEEQIRDLVNGFELEYQERVWNGMDGYGINSHIWISMESDSLPDQIYEEMGFYSPRQITAYNEQFPSCDYPVNIVFSDESKNCMCPMGALGEFGQLPSLSVSPSCYLCPQYLSRKSPLVEMKHEEFIHYQRFTMGEQHAHDYQNLCEKRSQ